MRYSSLAAVEYDLKYHYELLDKYTLMLQDYSNYKNYVLKTTKIRDNKRYYSSKAPGSRKFQYLGDNTNEEVQKIQECAFISKAIEVIQSNISIMEDFVAIYKRTGARHINELLERTYTLPSTNPLLVDDNAIIEWLEGQKKKKAGYPVQDPNSLTVTAFDGTLMRSRAEALHYEGYFIYNIPAVFEVPYEIGDEIFRPDFTLLYVYDMSTFLWEHLGNWFHENLYKRNRYRTEAVSRIDAFTTIGYYPEHNLLLSFGSNDNIFDIQSLHRKIAMLAAPPPSSEVIDLLKRM